MSCSICRASDLVACKAEVDTGIGLCHIVDEQDGAVLFELHLVFARINVCLFAQLAVLDQNALPFARAVRLDQAGQLLLIVLGP